MHPTSPVRLFTFASRSAPAITQWRVACLGHCLWARVTFCTSFPPGSLGHQLSLRKRSEITSCGESTRVRHHGDTARRQDTSGELFPAPAQELVVETKAESGEPQTPTYSGRKLTMSVDPRTHTVYNLARLQSVQRTSSEKHERSDARQEYSTSIVCSKTTYHTLAVA